MRAASLAFLRVSTGLLLVIWGLIKVAAPDAAISVSDTYYGGVLSLQSLQTPLGVAASLVSWAFCDEDRYALDRLFFRTTAA